MEKKKIEVGQIVGAHGINGEIKIQHWCDSADIFLNLKKVFLNGQWHQLFTPRVHKNIILAKLSDVHDRNTAESLRLCILEITRDQLPPLPENRYYICDLLGLTVITDENKSLGILSDVLDTGSNQVYEVTADNQKKYYLPVIDDVILNTDLEQKILTVHLLEGLI